jgi:hypothetical protein
MRDLALALDVLDCAENAAKDGSEMDLTLEARRLLQAHRDADVTVAQLVATLRQEVAKVHARQQRQDQRVRKKPAP